MWRKSRERAADNMYRGGAPDQKPFRFLRIREFSPGASVASEALPVASALPVLPLFPLPVWPVGSEPAASGSVDWLEGWVG